MNGDSELAVRIQKVIDAFGREAEKARAAKAGRVMQCKGCGLSVVSHGAGRPKVWCEVCREPGGAKDAFYREMRRLWAAKTYAKHKAERGDAK